MGYNHYWHRSAEIDSEAFVRIVADFQRCVLALDDAGVSLAGPMGDGLPRIDQDAIAFNGVRDCGHPKNDEIRIPFPSEEAAGVGSSLDAIVDSWFIGVQIRRRTCNGDCSYEAFVFERIADGGDEHLGDSGRQITDHCKTGFRPYDLAVQCALLIAKHHLEDRFGVASGGSDRHWNDARRLCYLHLGFPLGEFKIDREEGLIPG
ncbi:MAG TPA: hypothetical protein VE178_09015 [Silvibacterium sp.]|jgi:hypothetical protein|nr:hypothetical protein [Silvibacterium sp.]